MTTSFITWTIIGVLTVTADTGFGASRAKPLEPALPIVTTARVHDPSITEMAMKRTYQGGLLLMQGDLEGAIREFREAIRLSPDSPAPHNNVAMALHLQGHFAAAQAEFLIAIELDPSFAAAWNNLGFVLFDHGEIAAAVERWKSAVELDPKMPSAWGGLAIGLLAMGYVDQAAQSYRHALELDSQYGDVGYLHHVRHWSPRAMKHAGLLLDILKIQSIYNATTRITKLADEG